MAGRNYEYRGWHISIDIHAPSSHCWWYAHDDWDGDEDPRCGHAGTIDEAKEAIDEYIEGSPLVKELAG